MNASLRERESMRRGLLTTRATVAAALASVACLAAAQPADRHGKEVVEAVCASCHGTGANGAPRIGDSKAWANRASKGLSSLTKNALTGIRKMPAHGGNPNVTDTEIERAIAYMVNQSGGHWVEPISRTGRPPDRSGEEIVRDQCSKCHQAGVGGAPKPGDKEAWVPRLNRGLDTLVQSAIMGHGGMPPRGGQADLRDSELRAAILYMFNPAGPPKAAPKAAEKTPPGAGPKRLTAGGMDIYFGRVPAERMRAFAPGSAEARMHGGVPSGSGYYHVNVSLFDSASQAVIKDASVELDVEQVGMAREAKMLEPITLGGGASYGAYIRLIPKNQYIFVVRVKRPGGAAEAEVKFQERVY
jgi:cytochrome c5